MENRQSKKNVLKLSVLAYIPIGILMLLMSVLGAVFQSKTWNIEIFCTIKICKIVALVLPPALFPHYCHGRSTCHNCPPG